MPSEQQRAAQQAAQNERQTAYEALSEQLAAIERERGRVQLVLADAQGQRQVIPLSDIDSLWYPNAMSLGQKLRHLAAQTWRFVSLNDPVREGDGVFPAMAGTLLLVMSVIVMPLGVMAAIYLHEYAARHWLTRLIRIAVGNLAGVPSIVYGIAKKLNYGYTDFMSYSIDFRRRILSIKKHEELSIRETAKRFHIGTTTIVRWTKQIDARPATSRQRKIDKSALERDVEQYPDAYQRERAERFGVCQMAICKALKKLQLTYKKNSASSKSRRRH